MQQQSLNKTLILFLLFITTLAVQFPAWAASNNDALTPSKINYSASYNGMPIEVTRQLTFDADTDLYTLSSTAKSFFGSISESGQFSYSDEKITDNPILNKNYQYSRKIFGKLKKEQLVFDHANQQANYTSKKKQRQIKLDKPYQTQLSYQLRLQMDLLDNGTTFDYPVIARGKAKNYQFKSLGEELLSTPLGELNTVKITRIRAENDRTTTLWFAKDLNYLLVKLEQREADGQDYQIAISDGQINGVPLNVHLPHNTRQPTTPQVQQ